MKYQDLEKEFLKFKNKNGNSTFSKLGEFFNGIREIFEKEKNLEYKNLELDIQKSNQKTRQSWVAFLGSALEKIIFILISGVCEKNNLKVVSDKVIKSNNLDKELDLVKRALMVYFGEYSLLPDADLIIYSLLKDNVKVHCILSIKNSFRERYSETPYWKIKLSQNENTKNIKVFMVTPDNDDEISFSISKKPRKARIVMEYELDSIYLAKENFDKSDKVKNIKELGRDILKLLSK
jgi:type II restriction enzyme